MNGEIPSVPITTLAGIASLSDLLPELPLPSPVPETIHNNSSLLYHPQVADRARRLLATPDDNLVSQLVSALSQTNTDNIQLKDGFGGDEIEGEIPELLRAVLNQNPNVFKGGRMHDNWAMQHQQQQYQYPGQQMNHYGNHGAYHPQQPGYHVNQPSPYANQQNFHGQHSPYHGQQSPYQSGQSPYQAGGQHSPYPAGHMSPYPPTSPARYPQQTHSPAVHGQVGYQPNSPYPGHQQSGVQNKFQQQFSNFASPQGYPQSGATVNGGSQMQYQMNRTQAQGRKSSTVSSPAHASAAPPGDEPGRQQAETPHEMIPSTLDDIEPSFDPSRPPVEENNSHLDESHSVTPEHPKKKKKSKKPMVVLEPLEDFELPAVPSNKDTQQTSSTSIDHVQELQLMTPQIKLTKVDSRGKKNAKSGSHGDSSRRGNKRQREGAVWNPDAEFNAYGDFAASLSDRVKRRRRAVNYHETNEDGEIEEAPTRREVTMTETLTEFRPDSPMDVPKKKKKDKVRRPVIDANLTTEELMETATFKRFNSSIDAILDQAEEADLTNIDLDDDDAACPPESLIGKNLLADLCSEAAKLKTMNVMNEIPYERLVKLLTILQWNIRDGAKVLLLPNANEDEGADESRLWRELTMERVNRSVDAALTALHIMTSSHMPKQVYIEDVIDRLVFLTKYQLINTIYPEFDPVYKVTPKGQFMSVRMKRAHAKHVKHKTTLSLYNKLTEIIGCLSELVEIQELTDTVVLQVSSLGVTPFFVENISELQLNAMKLVTTTFSRYEKHRQLILEDIFSSLARLPSSKRNLRSYRMNSEDNIQMVTALALQLIQCVIKLPAVEEPRPGSPVDDEEKQKNVDVDKEVVIITSYETAMRTGHNFLSVFLKKCAMKGEDDYRPLFENFVQDLLGTVNKPEWPAAELILSLLGRLLVQQFSNKSVEMSMRVASLDYLGIVAARLRKDAISSRLNQDVIDEIVERVTEDDKDSTSGRKTPQSETEKEQKDQTEILQKAMLDYLAYNSQNDPALVFARKFYIAQWYRDSTVMADKVITNQHNTSREDKDSDDEPEESEAEKTTRVLQQVERSKHFLMSQVPTNLGAFASYRSSLSKLDFDSSCLVARYLASNRPFSQSFDIYLTQILKVLCETAVAVRTKAMKCLTAVIEADPGILARKDMRSGVHGRFLDHSTSVREAAVELVGKFIVVQPQLTEQYYEMLSERILDTGISVRKRVIKIFRDICLDQPDFKKIPEMCVKMIRRVSDEEGIKKLVNDVFQNMWFTPIRDRDTHKLLTKVMNITDVVTACKDHGFDFLEQLLTNLFTKESESQAQAVAKACRQIVDCLVENVLRLEERSAESGGQTSSSPRLVACLSTLYLFAKIKPELLVQHAQTLQPYLNITYKTQADNIVLHHVACILELVVPLMANPGENFLVQLEEDMMKLILRHGQMVLQACVSCLGAVVNHVSHNYKLVRDCFQKFFGAVCKVMMEHKQDPKNPLLQTSKPTLLRALFTVGLLCKHFDFDAKEMGESKVCVSDRVFEVLMYFIDHEDENVKTKSLTGLGFLCTRKYEYMLGTKMKTLYHSLLTQSNTSVKLKCQVLHNLKDYLTDEEVKMFKADAEWKKLSKKEDLKEMCDVQSGMASTIMQLYLKHVLESFFQSQSQVRSTALNVVQLVLQQGLVHPVQCVPYMVAIGTDCEAPLRNKSDQQLKDIDKKYPGFIHMKAMQGIKFSYRLQCLIQQDLYEPIRGIRDDSNPQSLNAFLYTIVRTNRQHRRGLLLSLLNLFDDTSKTSLSELLYIADNLAFFPYLTMDEPLFIMHQIDIILSVSGPNLIQSFKEAYTGEKMSDENNGAALADIEDEEFDTVLDRLPEDTSVLQQIMLTSLGCVLLLKIKQHLKEMFGFTDSKLHQYSPTEAAKVWEKPLSRKCEPKFNPKEVLECLRNGSPLAALDTKAKVQLLQNYFDFKELILSIDPAESSDDESTGRVTPIVIRTKLAAPTHDASEEESGNEVPYAGPDSDDSDDDQPGPSTNIEPQVQLRELKIIIPLAKVKEAKEKKSHHSRSKKDKKKKSKKKKKYISSSEEDQDSLIEDSDDDDDFML